MTGYSLLDNLVSALTGNSALCTLVNSKIYKNKAISASVIDLNGDVNKSLISCELSEIAGQILYADQTFIVDIRTRKEIAGDGGAEYCIQIADAIRAILDDGFSGATVTKISGVVAWDAIIKGYRCKLQVATHIKSSFTLTLTPNQTSPKVAGCEIVLTAIASPNTDLEYRFLINGPGSGSVLRDLTGWQSKNSFVWKTTEADVGTSTIYVEIRGGQNKGAADQSTSISYVISTALGAIPVIVSLAPDIASPQPPGTELMIICTATSSNGSEIIYKFWHQLPGGAWIDVSSWTTQNFVRWKPTMRESGSNAWKVWIIDQKHAGRGTYDATASISYTVAP